MQDSFQQGLNSLSDVFNNPEELMRRLITVEDRLNIIQSNASLNYIQGRLRTNRVVPANSADVVPTDQLWDRIIGKDYEYILRNNGGTLQWVQISLSTF